LFLVEEAQTFLSVLSWTYLYMINPTHTGRNACATPAPSVYNLKNRDKRGPTFGRVTTNFARDKWCPIPQRDAEKPGECNGAV
jgi:hypothetical protein